jgi:hypothetical protein
MICASASLKRPAAPFQPLRHPLSRAKIKLASQMGGETLKTDKELAVELMGNYLRAVYSQEKMKALDPEGFKKILNACYDAVKSLPTE